MLQLLSLPSLFVDIGNFNLSQLTGEPIIELSKIELGRRVKRKREDDLLQKPIKRIKRHYSSTTAVTKQPGAGYWQRAPREWPTSDIPLPRSAAFNAQPVLHNMSVQFGFPTNRESRSSLLEHC